MLVARIEAGSVAVDVEIEAASAPGGPVSLHDVSVRRESAARLAASGLPTASGSGRGPSLTTSR